MSIDLELTGNIDFMGKTKDSLSINKDQNYIEAYTKLCSFCDMRLLPWEYTLESSGIIKEVKEWSIGYDKYDLVFTENSGLKLIIYNYTKFSKFDKKYINIRLSNRSINIHKYIMNLRILEVGTFMTVDIDKNSQIYGSLIGDTSFVVAFNKEDIESYIDEMKTVFGVKHW